MTNEASPLTELIWPPERLGEALELLARKLGYLAQPVELPGLPAHVAQADDAEVGRWLTAAAGQLRLEVEAVQVGYDEVDGFVRRAAPAIVRLRGESPGLLVLLKASPRRVSLLTPDLSTRRVAPGQIRAALCHPLEAPFAPPLARLLTEAGVPEHRRAKAAAAILAEQLGSQPLSAGWLLRLPPGGNFWRQMWHAGLAAPVAATIGGQVLQQAMGILAWVMIGRAVFAGYFEPAWLLAWALVLFSAIPFQLLTRWGQNQVSLKAGGLFKQRLLFGTLQLESDEIRHQGAGQFLGRVMESEAVEMLAINGGFMAIVSVIELAMAAAVLTAGAGGWAHALLLLGWTALALGIGWRYYRRNTGRTNAYRAMTNDQVEGMVGHRTRLAQEDHRRWHDKEDQTLAHYLKLLEQVDGIGLQLSGLIPRGWLLVGMAGLAYTFIFQPASTVELAVSVGGICWPTRR
jgi:ATP-binding cassette subfamily B protein